jgi:predicted transposase YdaD
VPVLKGGGNEPAIKKAVHLLRADENLQELEPLLAFFARFALESEVIRQIMRWDMAVLRESPWYNEILAEGREEGREEGQQEFLLYVLQRRFGPLPIYLKEQINQLNGERMQQLLDVTLEAKSLVQIEQFFKRDKRAEDN